MAPKKTKRPHQKSPITGRIAVMPGSFDPLTNGHVDLVRRSLKTFDRVIVAVLSNPEKEKGCLFSVEERVAIISEVFADSKSRVSVQSFSGLLVDFVRQFPNAVVVRGLRAVSDFDYEAQMALVNKMLCDEVETFFLTSREQYSYISSTLVRQIVALGGPVTRLVPGPVAKHIRAKVSVKSKQRLRTR